MTNLRDDYDLACPSCGQADELIIDIKTLARVTSDGSEPEGDHEWDNDSSREITAISCTGRCRRDPPEIDPREVAVAQTLEAGNGRRRQEIFSGSKIAPRIDFGRWPRCRLDGEHRHFLTDIVRAVLDPSLNVFDRRTLLRPLLHDPTAVGVTCRS